MHQTCHACGGSLVPRFSSTLDPVTRESFAIHTCAGCGFGHTVPQPESLGRYYGDTYHGNRHGLTARFCTGRRLGFVAAAMEGQTGSGRRLLDVGCGDGSFLLAARSAGWEVTGTEMNPALARRAGLDVREGFESLTDCAPFDCVTLWHSLEHMRDIRATLVHVSGLLKPDGRLIVAVPDNGGFQARVFRQRWLHLDVPRHLYHFTDRSLTICLERAGFSVQRRWHQELEYDLLGWSQSALNWLFPCPNLFFCQLTGKPVQAGLLCKAASYVSGLLLTALALPAVALGTRFGRGGTLVAVARPKRGAGPF